MHPTLSIRRLNFEPGSQQARPSFKDRKRAPQAGSGRLNLRHEKDSSLPPDSVKTLSEPFDPSARLRANGQALILLIPQPVRAEALEARTEFLHGGRSEGSGS